MRTLLVVRGLLACPVGSLTIVTLILAYGFAGCASNPPATASAGCCVPDEYDYSRLDHEPIGVGLYFGTDRRERRDRYPGYRFGTTPADSMTLGRVVVNVPSYRARTMGETKGPPFWRRNLLWNQPSPDTDMYVEQLDLLTAQVFRDELDELVSSFEGLNLFVFVHGYNVSFDAAALRTAQLAADINFPGVPMFYSWTSQGEIVGYIRDQVNANNSASHLADFLTMVLAEHSDWRVHLIAHSMGSEVLVRALERLEIRRSNPQFDQIVLIAPDLDVRPFRREGLALLRRHSQRVTLYSSNEDVALKFSRELQGVWRLGLGGDSLVVLPYMDTIDATRVRTDWLGHGSFESASFLYDISTVLNEGTPPPRRLLRVKRGDLAFYRFRPAKYR
jgi:esterase/lipase superfamily enzyme